MSNLLEQASLVMIPSGYKEDIVYSVIPTSGAGDLTFTRASNGTRIDSNGNVEVVPWNLLEYSEQFDNAIWQQIGTTITANATTAPNGTTTAERYQASASARGVIYQTITIPAQIGVVCTFSVYGKVASGTQQLRIGADQSCSYPSGAKIITLTTEWQRFDVQVTSPSTNGFFNPFIDNITDNTNACGGTAINADCFIWGAQLNIGSTAKPYFPTTDRLNVPRLTYQNGGGGCPSLLLEKQSTNLATYSEQLDNAAWTKIGSTISSNVVTSPDGTQDADKIAEDNSTQLHYVSQGGYMGSAGAYSASIYLKAAERTWAFVYIYNGTDPAGTLAFFNLSNGTIGTVDPAMTASITDVGNGWYRCIINRTIAGNAAAGWGFGTSTGNGNSSFTGTTGSGIYAWGAQCELSSYPTSYIPTTSSSATRVADACYKTGISSLIGQTEGVAFIDFDFNGNYSSGGIIPISLSGTSGNEMYIWIQTNGQIRFDIFASSAGQVAITGNIGAIGRKKMAVAYKQNDFAFYMNGSLIGIDTSGNVPPLSSVYVGKYYANNTYDLNAGINQAILFPTRLTNSELAQLTGNQNYTINQAYESYGVASESPNCVQP